MSRNEIFFHDELPVAALLPAERTQWLNIQYKADFSYICECVKWVLLSLSAGCLSSELSASRSETNSCNTKCLEKLLLHSIYIHSVKLWVLVCWRGVERQYQPAWISGSVPARSASNPANVPPKTDPSAAPIEWRVVIKGRFTSMNMGYLAPEIISGDALHNPLKCTRKPCSWGRGEKYKLMEKLMDMLMAFR